MSETSPHVLKNREHWESRSADYQGRNRDQLNRDWDTLRWGVWDVPETDVDALGDVAGLDALEYGCGAGQTGIKVARTGARVIGLDFSGAQLREALRLMDETGVRFPVVQADGERIPLADESFDLVWCDHGVMGFADPRRTVPEVARVLRPGGRFVFCMLTPLLWIATDPEADAAVHRLVRPYFGMRSEDLEDPQWRTTEFQLAYGDWIRLFRANGLIVEDLIELRPAEDATSTYIPAAELPWARDYPMDHIWKLRKA